MRASNSRVPPDPQAIKWPDPEDKRRFQQWLEEQIQQGIDARARWTQEGGLIDTWHGLYEQAERASSSRPWADSADLASYIPTEKVDAFRARMSQVVFGVDPICTVEGWGEDASRVAKVEAFHQWKAEDERLQTWVTKACHQALIEANGILEVNERLTLKKTRAPFRAKIHIDEQRRPILGENLQFQPAKDEAGAFVPHGGDPAEPYLDILREQTNFLVQGPQYRILSGKDFLYLPAHAKDLSEVWGYAKRIYLRGSELGQRVQQGIYDGEAVEKLGKEDERESRSEHRRQGLSIQATDGPTAEKELWEVHLLYDVDGDDIEEWLIACISLRQNQLLRCAYDHLEQPRFVSFVPFPRADSVWGYSFVGHKLWTLAEEHTALRNMKADRQALALNAPFTRLSTSLWDPDDEPFGPGAVIDVRSHDEIKQLQIADVPNSTIESERTTLSAAERVTGLNDTAVSGASSEQKVTATEITAVSQASFVRVEEAVRHIQESVSDLYTLRHHLWQRALQANDSGIVAPSNVSAMLQTRGVKLPEQGPYKFTSADLDGSFKFKPRGSVETADKGKLRADLAELIAKGIPALMQAFPGVAQQFAQNPAVGKEFLEQMLRLYGFANLQIFAAANPAIAAPQGVQPMAPGTPQGVGLPPQLAQLMAGMGHGGAPPTLVQPPPGVQ